MIRFVPLFQLLTIAYGEPVERICNLESVFVNHGDRPEDVDERRFFLREMHNAGEWAIYVLFRANHN